MKFIDEAIITVQSGDGGKGCLSFRREKFIPRGGPDGGDGGKGGDIILSTTSRKRTLYQFRFQRHFKAKNGEHGQGKKKTGKNGLNLTIELPPGTLVIDADTGHLIKDLVDTDETFVILKGGRGGQGNTRFKTSTHRTPRFAQPGEPGETITLKLELKLLADVGIIGLPNAGKSTLIAAISSARPKIANYPFTTLTPSLGVVQTDWAEPFVVADIPGLIKGAHQGTGLGIKFLRHIERTRILVHLIDVSSIDPDDPLHEYHTINQELVMYDEKLVQKPQIVVLNKLDLPGVRKAAEIFQSAIKDKEVLFISALTGQGLEQLKSQIVQLLDSNDE
ncbi:MAG: GTPase ObgE [Desulfobacteraceae bacterium]|nr:GTPase ObgE [Desulfobacteraceae bacterium]MDH3720863.1 GTPase ObgE [Desulfobacteraceae bacterium]MDH3836420.1 GTPase ObgE [Desulfobacteraceae bacterium]MDH3873848.1 GTPase ObgE [Desulfobacteraceae bacterium]MDH3955392.1 GTPase ObgE [Desulfobacteraceae bacterium]